MCPSWWHVSVGQCAVEASLASDDKVCHTICAGPWVQAQRGPPPARTLFSTRSLPTWSMPDSSLPWPPATPVASRALMSNRKAWECAFRPRRPHSILLPAFPLAQNKPTFVCTHSDEPLLLQSDMISQASGQALTMHSAASANLTLGTHKYMLLTGLVCRARPTRQQCSLWQPPRTPPSLPTNSSWTRAM